MGTDIKRLYSIFRRCSPKCFIANRNLFVFKLWVLSTWGYYIYFFERSHNICPEWRVSFQMKPPRQSLTPPENGGPSRLLHVRARISVVGSVNVGLRVCRSTTATTIQTARQGSSFDSRFRNVSSFCDIISVQSRVFGRRCRYLCKGWPFRYETEEDGTPCRVSCLS